MRLGSLLGLGIIFTLGLTSPTWARSSGARSSGGRENSAPLPRGSYSHDPKIIEMDRQRIEQDAAQMKQHREAFRKQLADLKVQRAQALKSENAQQLAAIEQQMDQLGEKARDQQGEDRFQLVQDQRRLKADKQGGSSSQGKKHNKMTKQSGSN